MMKREMFEIARIYVPMKRRATLESAKVAALAQGILTGDKESDPGAAGRTAE